MIGKWRRASTAGLLVLTAALATTTGNATAAPARTTPHITTFKISTTTLPSTRGRVTLRARVIGARTCAVVVKPAIKGLHTGAVSCRSNTFSKRLRLPHNPASLAAVYRFTLVASNHGHYATAVRRVSVAAPSPVISHLVVTPSVLPSAGGVVQISAVVAHAHSCFNFADPAGSRTRPVRYACSRPSGTTKVFQTFRLQPNVTSTPITYRVGITAHGRAGYGQKSKRVTVQGAPPSPLTWDDSTTFDPPVFYPIGFYAVSCPSETFCAAVEGSGHVVERHGTDWGAPIDVTGGGDLLDVSCPSATRCVAIGEDGKAYIDNDDVWSDGVDVSASEDLVSLSCPTVSRCVALDIHGGAYLLDGDSWGSRVLVDPDADQTSLFEGVSCASADFCMVVGGGDDIVMFNGTNWTVSAHTGGGLRNVSCVSTTFCMATSYQVGGVETYDGTGWTGQPAAINQLESLSCVSTTFCLATNAAGAVSTYNGSTWSSAVTIDSSHPVLSGSSCPTTDFCEVVGAHPNNYESGGYPDSVVSYDQGTWAAPIHLLPLAGQPSSISCVGDSFCAAVDARGSNAFVWQAGAWSAPTPIDQAGTLNSVSCASSAFCMAVGDGGVTSTYDGNSWSAQVLVDPYSLPQNPPVYLDLIRVSCPSSQFCAAIDRAGNVVTYDGATWSDPTPIDASGLRGISCASSTFCVAVGGARDAVVFKGGAWSAPVVIDTAARNVWMNGVSCPSTIDCMAIDDRGHVVRYNGSHWLAPRRIAPRSTLVSISCPSVSSCGVLNEQGMVVTYDGHTWSAPTPVNGSGPTDVWEFTDLSCASSHRCVVVGVAGDAITGSD